MKRLVKKIPKKVFQAFTFLDQRLLDLQGDLCTAHMTHRADQVDILRRALSQVLHQEVQYRRQISNK